MQVSISNIKYNKVSDPKKTYDTINSSFSSSDINLYELLNHVFEEKSWSNIIWKDNARKKDNFLRAESVVVDVDKDIPLAVNLAYLQESGLMPNMWYYTQSSTQSCEKYRMVWTLGEPIGSQLYTLIVHMLVDITGGDTQCRHLAVMWLGSSVGGEVVHTANLDILNLSTAWYAKQEGRGGVVRKEAAKTLQRLTGVANTDGFFSIRPRGPVGIDDGNERITSIWDAAIKSIIIGTSETEEIRDKSDTPHTTPIEPDWQSCGKYLVGFAVTDEVYSTLPMNRKGNKDIDPLNIQSGREPITNYDWDLLDSRCPYFHNLMNGTIPYIHREDAMDLALTFAPIKGGSTKYVQIIRNTSGSKLKEDNRIAIFNWAISQNPTAPSCKNFCPYFNDCPSSKGTMLRTGQIAKEPTRMESLPVISPEDAREKLTWIYDDIMKQPLGSLSIVTAPAGIGKTTQMINHFDHGCMIAELTHEKCIEVVKELEALGHYICYPVERPCLYDAQKPVRELVELELVAQAAEMICEHHTVVDACNQAKDLIQSGQIWNDVSYSKIYEDICEYQSSRLAARTATKVVCTHAYLMATKPSSFEGIETVFIDEDICIYAYPTFDLQIDHATCLYNSSEDDSLRGLLQAGLTSPTFKSILAREAGVIKSPEYFYSPVHMSPKEFKRLAEYTTHIKQPLEMLMRAEAITRTENEYRQDVLRIQAVNRITVGDKRVVLSTATPSISRMTTDLFSHKNPKYYEIADVMLKGRVEHHDKACYRKQLKDSTYVDKITAELHELGIHHVITYKKYAQLFVDAGFDVICTFGNELGVNKASGKNIAIVGTYISSPSSLMLKACLLKESKVTQTVPNTDFQYNKGLKYWSVGYQDDLTNQLMQQEALMHLIQSVGRARLIDNDCTVHVFGNVPHPQSINI